ncbi:MAG: hypothetical protein WEB00_14845 [Dehalococcoidia bacterium]
MFKKTWLAFALGLLASVSAALWGLGTANAHDAPPVDLQANVSCRPDGGIDVIFRITNQGRQTLNIHNDFHLYLDERSGRPDDVAMILFVWPAPTHDTIHPGETKRFLLDFGAPFEGELGEEFQGRLELEAEVWFEGYRHSVRELWRVPGCGQQ